MVFSLAGKSQGFITTVFGLINNRAAARSHVDQVTIYLSSSVYISAWQNARYCTL